MLSCPMVRLAELRRTRAVRAPLPPEEKRGLLTTLAIGTLRPSVVLGHRASIRRRERSMKAVRFDRYGGIDVLKVVDAPVPEPAQGEVLVKVKAASINPGEAKIREGMFHNVWPASFPSGEGSDLAGIVTRVGIGVEGVTTGDEVIGFTHRRASHAEYVVVDAQNLTRKPANVSWEVAGSLAIAGSTAYASVRAVSLKQGDSVAVSGAAGG